MARSAPSTTKRKPRLDSIKAVNLTLTKEAASLLSELAPTSKSHGRFVSDLILDYQRRGQFRDFYEKESRRQLTRLCKQLRQDARRDDGA